MAPIEEHGALWKYSPLAERDTATWNLVQPAEKSASYPAARSYHAIASNGTDTIYVHAGCPEKGRLSDLWAFNTSNNTWKALAPAPDPPRGGASLAFSGGKLYRAHGFDGTLEQGGSLDVYDTSNNAWSSILYEADGVNGPAARSVSVLVALKVRNTAYLATLFGEGQPSSLGHAGAGKMFSDAWLFNIEEGSWSKVEHTGQCPPPRGWFSADVMVDGAGNQRLIVHGGLAEDNTRLGDVWALELG